MDAFFTRFHSHRFAQRVVERRPHAQLFSPGQKSATPVSTAADRGAASATRSHCGPSRKSRSKSLTWGAFQVAPARMPSESADRSPPTPRRSNRLGSPLPWVFPSLLRSYLSSDRFEPPKKTSALLETWDARCFTSVRSRPRHDSFVRHRADWQYRRQRGLMGKSLL